MADLWLKPINQLNPTVSAPLKPQHFRIFHPAFNSQKPPARGSTPPASTILEPLNLLITRQLRGFFVFYPCFWISFASQFSAVSAVFAGGIELDGVLAA
jgi:hypothetical protein